MDENPLVEAIQKQVEAKYLEIAELKRQNDLNEASLQGITRLREAEKQRLKTAFDINDKVSGLLVGLAEIIEKITRIDQQCIELRQWLERTDDILVLLLTEKSSGKVNEARDDLQEIINQRNESRNKLIKRRLRNLEKLKEQAAEYGSIDTPLSILNKIEAEQEELNRLLE